MKVAPGPLGDVLLVCLLARRAAIHAPCRLFEGRLNANFYLAKRDFATTGIPWESGQTSPAAQKRASRSLETLTEAGLIRPVKATGRTTGIHLTDSGEHRAQLVADMPTLESGIGIVSRIIDLQMWLPEDDALPRLFGDGFEYDRIPALLYLADLLIPWIVRGVIEAKSTVLGNVRYREGAGDIPDEIPEDEGDEDARPEGRALYIREYDAYRRRLETEEPREPGQIGPIPLGCSWNYPNEYYVPSIHGPLATANA